MISSDQTAPIYKDNGLDLNSQGPLYPVGIGPQMILQKGTDQPLPMA